MNENKLVNFLEENEIHAKILICCHYPFSDQDLTELHQHLDWRRIKWNKNINWTLEMVDKYKYKWYSGKMTYELLKNDKIGNINGIVEYLEKEF